MDTSAIIEADVLLKMGMGDSLQQTHVLSLIHTCCTFVTEERFESISTFGRCLKRKVLETETIADEVQALRADVKSKTAELEDAKTASALLNSEIADLKAQLRAERERMQRYREEAHDLREIQKHASKTTGELNSRISALNIELASSDSKWERKHTDAKRELSNVKRANSRLLEEAATLRKTVERKSAEAKAAKEQARALNADLHRLSDEREAATSEITDRALRFQNELEQARAELAQPRRINFSSFVNRDTGEIAICPVPTRTGHIESLHNVATQWKTTPPDNDGELHATFVCPFTGFPTAIASVEQLMLVSRIATDLGISTESPLCLQRRRNDKWESLPLTDQIGLLSRACRIHRRKVATPQDALMVMYGQGLLNFQLEEEGGGLKITLACAGQPVQTRVRGGEAFFDGMAVY